MDKRENNPADRSQSIDLLALAAGMWRHFRTTWWLLILLCAVCAGAACAFTTLTYTPVYTAYASFSVDNGANATSYLNSLTQVEIAETFPYILESGALQNIVMEQLGVEELDAEITATVLEETSLFQISVTAKDPNFAYEVLEAVVENYPPVAKYIIGETELVLLDSSGIPGSASNAYSIRSLAGRGILCGAVLYLGFLTFLAFTRKTVMGEADLRESTSLNYLAGIPQVNKKRRSRETDVCHRIDQDNIGVSFKESVNMLRVRVRHRMEKSGSKIVMVTSTGEGEGKTTIAVNLSLAFANKGYHVLLLDADLRRPSVAQSFGRKAGWGLPEVLERRVTPGKALVRYSENLYLLSGEAADRTEIASILGGADIKALFSELKNSFDYIVVDTPPCGLIPDAMTLASACEEAILVIKQDDIAKDRILSALENLVDTGIRMTGFVINSEKTGIGSYGYGRYGYGRYGYGRYGYGQSEADGTGKDRKSTEERESFEVSDREEAYDPDWEQEHS